MHVILFLIHLFPHVDREPFNVMSRIRILKVQAKYLVFFFKTYIYMGQEKKYGLKTNCS